MSNSLLIMITNSSLHFISSHKKVQLAFVFVLYKAQYSQSYLVNFRYSKCGRYVATLTASNSVSSKQCTIRTDVICRISGVDSITTNPPIKNNVIEVFINTTLSIEVNLLTGSFPEFSITWGDGNTSKATQNSNVIPTVYKTQHIYRKGGRFNWNLLVTNKINSENKTLTISVKHCPLPVVEFQYGTRESPIVYTRGMTIKLTATYKFLNTEDCIKYHRQNFQIISWKRNELFTNRTFPNQIDKSTFDGIVEDKVIYHIGKLSLPIGLYEIVFTTKYENKTYEKKGYIKLTFSPLVATIESGSYRTVPVQFLTGNDEDKERQSLPYNFTLDGSKSYDPDNIESVAQGLEFSWFCRLASETNEKYNKTMCMGSSWSKIGDNNTKLEFSSTLFNSGLEYDFQLVVKDKTLANRENSSFVQRIKIVKGEFPRVAIRYVSRCPTTKFNHLSAIHY